MNKKRLSELKLEEFKGFNDLFEGDINKKISIEECVNERKSYGGTGIESVEKQIKDAKEFLKK